MKSLVVVSSILSLGLSQSDIGLPPSPGVEVDLGGYVLHAIERGSGNQTVVYFHGAGNASPVWLPVMNELADTAHQVAFDDPGAGWSDLGPLNATIRQQAFDAERALEHLGIDGAVLLVGHSRGGLVALEFARQFRDRVSGVVLVDSSHPDMMLRFRNPDDGSFSWQAVRTRQAGRLVPSVSADGMPDDLDQNCFTPRRDVSETTADWNVNDAMLLQQAYNLPICQPEGVRTYFPDELEFMGANWAEYHLGDLPLAVLYATERSYPGDQIWTSDQLSERSRRLSMDLLQLSDDARDHPMGDVSHAIHLDAPMSVASVIASMLAGNEEG